MSSLIDDRCQEQYVIAIMNRLRLSSSFRPFCCVPTTAETRDKSLTRLTRRQRALGIDVEGQGARPLSRPVSPFRRCKDGR